MNERVNITRTSEAALGRAIDALTENEAKGLLLCALKLLCEGGVLPKTRRVVT